MIPPWIICPLLDPWQRVQWTGFFLGSTHCAHWEIHMPILQIMKTIILKSLRGTRAFCPFWEFWLTLPPGLPKFLTGNIHGAQLSVPKHSITHFRHMQISHIRQSAKLKKLYVCPQWHSVQILWIWHNICKDESKTIPAPKKKRRLQKLENFERCLKGDSVTKESGPTTPPSIWNQFRTQAGTYQCCTDI